MAGLLLLEQTAQDPAEPGVRLAVGRLAHGSLRERTGASGGSLSGAETAGGPVELATK